MRRTLLFLVFVVVSMIAKAQFVTYEPVYSDRSYSTPSIPNYSTPITPRSKAPFVTYTPAETVITGRTYNAVVLYESASGHEANYNLSVVVDNGYVKKINLNNNGGCVHTGINNSGYKYYGGKLEYIKDLDAYATEVTVVYSDFWQKFTVLIE